MNRWISSNKYYVLGAIVGALSGFMYYKYVGCITGTCTITSHPVYSTMYFAAFGAILVGAFKIDKKQSSKNL